MSLRKKSKQNEILYGINPVSEAILATKRRIFAIYYDAESKNPRIPRIIESGRTLCPKIIPTDKKGLESLCHTRYHQGIVASVSPFEPTPIGSLLEKGQTPLIAIADSITDPQNLGSLIRGGLCAGMNGLIIPKNRAAKPSPTVSKASAGAMEHARVSIVTNISATMQILKKVGLWIIGLDRDAPDSIYETDLTGPCAIVVGGEDTGIRPLVAKRCDTTCFIPQYFEFSSLNAAMAATIALFEAQRQRRIKKQEVNKETDR